MRGDLIIHFKVEFPDQVAKGSLKPLSALLPGKPQQPIIDDDVIEEHKLVDVTNEMAAAAAEQQEQQAGRNVQCAPQ